MAEHTDGPSLWVRLALVVNGGLAVAFACLWVNHAIRGDFWRADFLSFYLGGNLVWNGDGVRLYDLDLQRDYQDRLVPERASEGLLAYVNPPHAALIIAPLASMSRAAAFYTWTAILVGLLLLLFRFMLADAADWQVHEKLLVVATVLAFPPLFMTFQLGQWSLLGLVCLFGFYRSLRNRADLPAAAWLVLGSVKPQLIVIPAVTLLVMRRWRALGLAVLLFGLWAAVATINLGPACWTGFLGIVAHNARQFDTYGVYPGRMYNLKGLLAALLGADHLELINGLATVALVVAMVTTAWIFGCRMDPPARGRRLNGALELAAALTVLLGLVCNPHFNPADALCLVLPGWLYLLYLRRAGRPWQRWAAFLTLCPLPFLLDEYVLSPRLGGVHPFFFILLGALGVMAREYRRASRTIEPVSPTEVASP